MSSRTVGCCWHSSERCCCVYRRNSWSQQRRLFWLLRRLRLRRRNTNSCTRRTNTLHSELDSAGLLAHQHTSAGNNKPPRKFQRQLARFFLHVIYLSSATLRESRTILPTKAATPEIYHGGGVTLKTAGIPHRWCLSAAFAKYDNRTLFFSSTISRGSTTTTTASYSRCSVVEVGHVRLRLRTASSSSSSSSCVRGLA